MSLLTLTLATIAICNALSLDIVSTSTTKNLNVPKGTIYKITPYFRLEKQGLVCKKVVVASTRPEDVYCINLHSGIIWYKRQIGVSQSLFSRHAKNYGWFQNYPDTRKWQDIANFRFTWGLGTGLVNKHAMYGVSRGGWTYKINGLSSKLVNTGNLRKLAVCMSKHNGGPVTYIVLGISSGGWLYRNYPYGHFNHPHGWDYDLKELACAGENPRRGDIDHLWIITKSKGHVYHKVGMFGAWSHHHEGLEHTSNGAIASTSNMVSIAVCGKQGEWVYAVDTQGRLWEWGQWYDIPEAKNYRFKGSGTPKWRLSGAQDTTGKISSVSVAGDRADVIYLTNTKGAVFVSKIQQYRFTK